MFVSQGLRWLPEITGAACCDSLAELGWWTRRRRAGRCMVWRLRGSGGAEITKNHLPSLTKAFLTCWKIAWFDTLTPQMWQETGWSAGLEPRDWERLRTWLWDGLFSGPWCSTKLWIWRLFMSVKTCGHWGHFRLWVVSYKRNFYTSSLPPTAIPCRSLLKDPPDQRSKTVCLLVSVPPPPALCWARP